MRRSMLVAGLAAITVLGSVTPAAASQSDGRGSWSIAVYGDAPYGTSPTDDSQVLATPAFVDSVNADPDVQFVAHVGDIHSGKQYCTAPYDQSIYDLWTAYVKPVVFTPGDNEWTDCHKVKEGGGQYNPDTGQIDYVLDPVTGQPVDYAAGDPVANLALVRSMFFARAGQTLGGGHMRVLSQAQIPNWSHPTDAKFVENVMFERRGVLFVTINLPGGSNNDTDIWYGAPTASAAQTAEVAERTGADLRWLDLAFGAAALTRAKSVVIITQADMWDLDGNTVDHVAGYEPFVSSIAAHTLALQRPVLMFNGDSHLYRSDNPLSPTAGCTIEIAGGGEGPCDSVAYIHPGYNVPNFHRIVVHGSTFPLEWLKLTINTHTWPTGANTFGPFTWSRMTQAA
jgi:hypothetical protein